MDKWKSTERLSFQSALNQNADYSSQKSFNDPNLRISTSLKSKQRISKSIYDESKEYEPNILSTEKDIERTYLNKKRPLILMNKYHLSLASYIQDHKSDVKFSGTKRFCDKSGEYYLKNVLIEKNPENAPPKILPKLSLKEPTNLINCIIKCNGLQPLTKKTSEIQTKLPKNALTPIPMMNKKSIKSTYEGKELSNAERTAVHIRRLEYSTEMKKSKMKPLSKKLSSIILIQQWWKTIFSFIRIQRYFRGWMFRKKLMSYLDHEEALIEKILSIERNCNKLLMKRFVWKLTGEINYSIQSLIPMEDIPINQPFKKSKGGFNKTPIQLKHYFDKWKNRNTIKRSMVVSLLKINKRKRYFKISPISQERINKAIDLIKKVILKQVIAPLKNNVVIGNLKDKVLKTFENKLVKPKDKETEAEASTLHTIPNPSSAISIENSNSSSYRTEKEKELINKPKENSNRGEKGKKNECLNHSNSIDEKALLKSFMKHWNEISLKTKIIKKLSKEFKLITNKKQLKETYNKWKRYINYKYNQIQIASLLIVLHHNNELNKDLNRDYSNQLNNPIILDFPLTNKLKKDISSISEREENESSLDNNILSNSQTPIKYLDSNTDRKSQKCSENSKSYSNNNKEAEKKKDSFVYLRKKPAYNLRLDNYIQEGDQRNSNSNINSESDQLDQNENQIEYDESLTPKEKKSKAEGLQGSFFVSFNNFEIKSSYSSNKSFKDNNHMETQTEKIETRDIGVGTHCSDKEMTLQKVIINRNELKPYFSYWNTKSIYDIDKSSFNADQLNQSNSNSANQPKIKSNSYSYSDINYIKRNQNSIIEENDLMNSFQNQSQKNMLTKCNRKDNESDKDNQNVVNVNTNTHNNSMKQYKDCKSNSNIPANKRQFQDKQSDKLKFTHQSSKRSSRNKNTKITTDNKDSKAIIVNLKSQFDNWKNICLKKKIAQSLCKSKGKILNQTSVKSNHSIINRLLQIYYKSNNLNHSSKYINKWKCLNKKQNQYDNFLFILKTVISYNSQKETLGIIKENDLRIITQNALNRWNSKRILPKLISFRKKANFLLKMKSKKELHSLYHYYIHYYTQAKSLTLDELESFITKCQKTINHNHLNCSFNTLRQENNILKKIVLKSRSTPQKQKSNSLCKLDQAFSHWKLFLQDKSIEISNINYTMSNNNDFNSIKTLSRNNSKKSNNTLNITSNNPITFRHQTEPDQSQFGSIDKDKERNIDREIDNQNKMGIAKAESFIRKGYKHKSDKRYNYMNNRSQYMSSSIDARRNRARTTFTDNSRLNTEGNKRDDNNNTVTLPGRHNRSFDLIETKNETLRPIIYSSQCFYFRKDDKIKENNKVNLHSNFYSMFKFPNIERGEISNFKNPRIQVTKATIPYDNDDEKDEMMQNNPNLNKEIQNTIMKNCQDDIHSLKASNNNDNNKAGYHFTLPIKEQSSLIQVNTDTKIASEQIQKLSLVNYERIMNPNKSIKSQRRHNSASLDNNIDTKMNFKSGKNRNNSYDREIEEDEAFQLKEINHAQYYHSPVNHSTKNNKNNESTSIAGIYTNITKSSKRGKMPTFHIKKSSINNKTNTTIDVLSMTQNNNTNEEDDASNKYDSLKPLYLSSTFYESFQSKASKNNIDNKINDKGSQRHNKSLTIDLCLNDYNDTPSTTQGNIFDNNTHTYYTHRPFEAISPSLSYNFIDEFNHHPPPHNDFNNSMPKSIQSKTIWFKNANENNSNNDNSKGKLIHSYSQSQGVSMKINWGCVNFLLLKQFYETFHKRLLLNRLVNTANELNNHSNLCYLLKVTFIHRSSAQVNIVKELLTNWKQSLRRYNKKVQLAFKSINSLNSLLFIGGTDDKNNK